MSTSSQFLGSGRKPMQRGVAAAGTVTISAVDTTKAKVTNLGNNNAASQVVLTNSTTLTVTTSSGSVSWELEESY